MELQLPKGTRDFKPEQAIIRKKIVDTLKEVFELYGFSPLETPIFERFDVLSSKYAGGAEILKETFKLTDQGERELALRYDLTVPMCRFIAMNPNMKLPFKRYQVGEVFRDGPIAAARYRQFTQCDVDVVGNACVKADAEILMLTARAFQKLELDCIIKINNRKLLNELLDYAKIPSKSHETAILSIDKLEKIGMKSVENELEEKGISSQSIKKIEEIITIKSSNDEKIKKIKKIIPKSQGIVEIEELLTFLELVNVEVVFDISLARGLAYYTGTVAEVFLKDSNIKSAVCAGGRYDNIIGSFIGRGNYPAMGISFGLDRVYDACIEKKQELQKSTALVYLIPIGTLNESVKIAEELRSNGIAVDIDLLEKGPSKNLQYANSLGITFVLFVGEEELKQKKFKLKDMKSGKEHVLDSEELVEFLKKQ